ncbi:MAG TPA: DUF1844 domain-containing protein [Planctomycetaceae bacterium]|jgi:hypothetical protein|nr:DUF1844 domain-containing protein [Planctomycetaceae bacterium]
MMNNESVAEDQTTTGSSPQTGGSRVEVVSDEDWKNRVKAEAAALDQQFRTQPAGGAGVATESHPSSESAQRAQATEPAPAEARHPEPSTAREMPAPTFADLVGLLSAQAMMFLGLVPNPSTQKAETQLPMARYFIDMISILEDKTAGQLTKEESNILDDTLHSLRMTYMQRSKQTA